jgi:hypothetical protein
MMGIHYVYKQIERYNIPRYNVSGLHPSFPTARLQKVSLESNAQTEVPLHPERLIRMDPIEPNYKKWNDDKTSLLNTALDTLAGGITMPSDFHDRPYKSQWETIQIMIDRRLHNGITDIYEREAISKKLETTKHKIQDVHRDVIQAFHQMHKT